MCARVYIPKIRNPQYADKFKPDTVAESCDQSYVVAWATLFRLEMRSFQNKCENSYPQEQRRGSAMLDQCNLSLAVAMAVIMQCKQLY